MDDAEPDFNINKDVNQWDATPSDGANTKSTSADSPGQGYGGISGPFTSSFSYQGAFSDPRSPTETGIFSRQGSMTQSAPVADKAAAEAAGWGATPKLNSQTLFAFGVSN